MNFKPAQLESFCKKPDPAVKCVVLFGNNEGEISILRKKCAEKPPFPIAKSGGLSKPQKGMIRTKPLKGRRKGLPTAFLFPATPKGALITPSDAHDP